MKKVMIIFLFFIMLTSIGFAAEEISVFEGRIRLMKPNSIFLNNQEYNVIHAESKEYKMGFDIPLTEVWIMHTAIPYKIDFATLYGVGYVTKARVTLKDGIVHKIEVLEMQQ